MRTTTLILLALLGCARANEDFFDRRPPYDAALVVSFNHGAAFNTAPAGSPGTLSGNASVTTKATFDGTDDRVSFSDSSAMDMPGAFTFLAWLEPNSLFAGGLYPVAGKYNSTTGARSWMFQWSNGSSGVSAFRFFASQTGAGGAALMIYNGSPLPAGSGWSHVACVHDNSLGAGQRVKMYVNGAALTMAVFQNDQSLVPYNSAIPFYLAAGDESSTAGWKGNMDGAMLIRRALTAAEIGAIYAGGRR